MFTNILLDVRKKYLCLEFHLPNPKEMEECFIAWLPSQVCSCLGIILALKPHFHCWSLRME